MRFWGILRVSGLCLLAIGFHGQPVSCGIFKGPKKPKKDSNAKVSENLKDSTVKSKAVEKPKDSNVESPLVEVAEDSTVKSQDAVPEDRKEPHDHSDFSNDFNSEYEKKEPIKEAEKSSEEHEQHDVARKTETDVTNGPSTINLSDGSKNPDGSIATPSSNGTAKDMEAEQEERLKEISEDLKDSNVESSSQEPSSKSSAPAPKSNLVFQRPSWDVSQLANTIVFIKEFCEEVKGYKFSGNIPAGNIRKLSEACSWVSFYLKSFRWRRVRGLDENPYEDALKPEKFKDYAEWLKKHLPVIRTSMINMHNETLNLTEKQRETDTKVGPFIYGFVYTGKPWGELSHISAGGFFGSSTILESFKDLRSSLENVLKSFPKDSTVKSQAD